MYFTALSKGGTRELWLAKASDCWPADAVNGRLGEEASITEIRRIDDNLFLTSKDASEEISYWQLDPVDESVRAVDSVPPHGDPLAVREMIGLENYAALAPYGLRDDQWAAMGEMIVFVAYTPRYGSELWVADTEDSTPRLLYDVAAGPASSSPRKLLSTGTHIVFFAEDLNEGAQLWISDGTVPGTVPVKRLPVIDGLLDEYALLDEGILFSVYRRKDGSFNLTEMMPPYDRAHSRDRTIWAVTHSEPKSLTAVGDTLYFVLDDPAYGEEIWHVGPSPINGRSDHLRHPALLRDIRPTTAYDERTKTWTPLSGNHGLNGP